MGITSQVANQRPWRAFMRQSQSLWRQMPWESSSYLALALLLTFAYGRSRLLVAGGKVDKPLETGYEEIWDCLPLFVGICAPLCAVAGVRPTDLDEHAFGLDEPVAGNNQSPHGGGHHTGRTNQTTVTSTPPPGRRHGNPHGIIPPGQTPSLSLPKDVQTIVQQFQQQRTQLQSSLEDRPWPNASKSWQQLEALRDQLQAQLQAITAQAREQALDMREQFSPGFAPGKGSGSGVNPTGHGGKPRP